MKKIFALTAGAALLAVAGSASALTISGGTFAIAHQTTELTSATATGSLGQFNTALGTLNSATITIDAESISATTLQNNAAGDSTFAYNSDLQWFFELAGGFYGTGPGGTPGGGPAFTTGLANTANEADADFLGNITLAGLGDPAGNDFRDLGTATNSDQLILVFTGADLATFIGLGTFDIGCNTNAITTFSGGGGNIDPQQTTTGACGATVDYDYDAVTTTVPVPAPLALLALGMVGLGAARRMSK